MQFMRKAATIHKSSICSPVPDALPGSSATPMEAEPTAGGRAGFKCLADMEGQAKLITPISIMAQMQRALAAMFRYAPFSLAKLMSAWILGCAENLYGQHGW